MLHTLNRLSKTKDVQITMMRGRSFFSPHFVIKHRKSIEDKIRFTVVVSTKVSKKAVERNKIKRVLRDVIRLRVLPFARSGDYAIIVKANALGLTNDILRERIVAAFKASKLIV
jgi:ribonuclease P protein component